MATTATAQEKMNIVIVGHVDHGKSTLVGRLLADTHSLPEGKIEQIREECRRNSKPFEYAFLLDALKDEKQQGITIDTARAFFKSAKREYIIIDAPGHIEFLKNMVSGAARAEAALLVIDAQEGIQENSKRHGYLLSMLGIRQVAVCVNKMDLVGYRQAVFEEIEKSYRKFLKEIGLEPKAFIPLAALEGENLIQSSPELAWFHGPSVLAALDSFEKAPSPQKKPLRMSVQAVYKFTEDADNRRIVAGRLESGSLSVGDPVIFLPSNKRSVVKTIEAFNAPAQTQVSAGFSTGVTLTEQIYVSRGDILCKAQEEPPKVSSLLRVELFWMGRRPMVLNRPYKLKIATTQVAVRLKSIERVMDAATLKKSDKKEIGRHDVARCVLQTASPIAFDLTSDLEATSRFVIVDEYDIAGGGIIQEMIEDDQADLRRQVSQRELKWDFSVIESEERRSRYGHSPAFVLLTGRVGMDKKAIAKELEKQLFQSGAKTYFLEMGNLLRGLSVDVEQHRLERHEHVRRMGEVAHFFLDAGLIVVATASNLNDAELAQLHEVTSREGMLVVNVGPSSFKTAVVDLNLEPASAPAGNVQRIVKLLKERAILALCLFFVVAGLLHVSSALADTVYLKNKQEVRGVIVEDFADRYVLKTVDGEKAVMKAQAAAVKYDDPELSFYQLGRDLQRAGRLRDALSAYQKAVELRPGFQAARDAVFNVQRILDRQDEPQLLAEVHQKQVALEQAGRPFSGRPAGRAEQVPDPFGAIEKRFGILPQQKAELIVAGIQPGSAAASADLRTGDRLVAVAGEPLRHLKPAEAAQRLAAQGNELQLSIEREVRLERPMNNEEDPWGIRLEWSYDGLRIAKIRSGGPAIGQCQVGDLVVAIHGQSTRYMPMSDARRLMSQAGPLILSIQREVFIRQHGDKAPSQ